MLNNGAEDVGLVVAICLSCVGAAMFIIGGDLIAAHNYSHGTFLAVLGMCVSLPGIGVSLCLLIRRDIFVEH
jgi:hypothetical protein